MLHREVLLLALRQSLLLLRFALAVLQHMPPATGWRPFSRLPEFAPATTRLSILLVGQCGPDAAANVVQVLRSHLDPHLGALHAPKHAHLEPRVSPALSHGVSGPPGVQGEMQLLHDRGARASPRTPASAPRSTRAWDIQSRWGLTDKKKFS